MLPILIMPAATLTLFALERVFAGRDLPEARAGYARTACLRDEFSLRTPKCGLGGSYKPTQPAPCADEAGGAMPWRRVALLGLFLTCGLSNAHAQREIEVTPFFGTRVGGKIDLRQQGDPNVDFIKIKNSENYGVLADISLRRNLQGEFMWNRQPTSLTAHSPNDGTYTYLSKMNFDMYQFGVVYQFRRSEKKLRPFAGLEFGFSHYGVPPINGQPVLGFTNRFAMNMTAGAKYFFSKNFGIRTEFRWSPSNTTNRPVEYCTGPFITGCYPTTDPNSALQAQANVGLIFRFK